MALWSLAPDQRVEPGRFWPAVAPHGVVTSVRREGTLPGGGAFESDYLFLFVALGGRITRIEMFELDDLERAVARLAELRPDLLRIPPNAMARTFARWAEAIRRGDEHAVMALYAPSYALEDRRPHVRTSSDAGEGIGSVRWAIEGGWTGELTLLATAGDRLALHHGVWRTRHGGARSEIACLHVDEVDAEGRLVRSLVFDPGDRAAAYRVLAHRYTELTRPLALPRLAALQEAGRDLARLRAALPDGFVFYDRRRTGLGRLDGADAYLASVAALHDLAPDAMVGQPLYFLADAPHATLAIAHSFGRLADGGAYESVYAMITLYGPNGMVGAELFELEHLDAARARFDELRH